MVLGPALPKGFSLTGWRSQAPAVVASNGDVHIQAGPGRNTVLVMGRCTQACQVKDGGTVTLSVDPPRGGWPAQEVWSFQGQPAFRQANLEGVGVDANVAEVPDPWRALPAYRVQGKAVLRQHSRGKSSVSEQWTLDRQAWLWQARWTVEDLLQGERLEGQRIGMQSPWQLERASVDGRSAWITQGPNGPGLATTRGRATIQAQGSSPQGRTSASGWSMPVERMEVRVTLRPGETLLAAPGARRDSNTWISQLGLLSFFGAALFALVLRQAMGWRAGVLGGVMVVAWVGYESAQWMFWWMGAAAVLLLVSPLLPQGRLRGLLHVGQWLTLAMAALIFIHLFIAQAILVLHPDLERSGTRGQVLHSFAWGGRGQERMAMDSIGESYMQIGDTTSNSLKANIYQKALDRPDNAPSPLEGLGVSLAGRATPAWGGDSGIGKTYQLGFDGPLQPEDTTHLWVLPQGLVQVLRALGLLGLAWLAGAMAWRVSGQDKIRAPRWMRAAGMAALFMPALVLAQEPTNSPNSRQSNSGGSGRASNATAHRARSCPGCHS